MNGSDRPKVRVGGGADIVAGVISSLRQDSPSRSTSPIDTATTDPLLVPLPPYHSNDFNMADLSKDTKVAFIGLWVQPRPAFVSEQVV